MKLHEIIILILLFSCSLFGQTNSVAPAAKLPVKLSEDEIKLLEKRLRKTFKEQEKASGLLSNEKRKLDVFALFTMFPQEFDGRLFWLKNIPVSVEKQNGNGTSSLNVIFFTPERRRFETAFIYNGINFSVEDEIKQQAYAFSKLQTTNKSAFKTNIQVAITSFKNSKGYMIYPVKVNCIELLANSSQVMKTIGNCAQ